MTDPIITVENLGKRYQLRHEGNARYQTLRDALASKARQFLRPTGSSSAPTPSSEEFWALRDVTFEIQRGDVVGIIGRNGAGKSTLLKILSRITEPSTGRIRLRGRVASLLEVGTGFHAELSGRENIFLNGAILGMTKAEIRSKFDEIVAFAEVENFLDTPVKHYSSGMYVRLAFAVAAHLEPEILIVDEVLAVGDAEFQAKCLGKMQDVASHGRTVLFVSHNMPAVKRLCRTVALLARGSLKSMGSVDPQIRLYLDDASTSGVNSSYTFTRTPPAGTPSFLSIELRSIGGDSRNTFMTGEPVEIAIAVRNPLSAPLEAIVGVEIMDADGVSLLTSHSDDATGRLTMLHPGDNAVSLILNPNPLMPGKYRFQLGLVDRFWVLQDHGTPDVTLHIDIAPISPQIPSTRRPGRLLIPFEWSMSTGVVGTPGGNFT